MVIMALVFVFKANVGRTYSGCITPAFSGSPVWGDMKKRQSAASFLCNNGPYQLSSFPNPPSQFWGAPLAFPPSKSHRHR